MASGISDEFKAWLKATAREANDWASQGVLDANPDMADAGSSIADACEQALHL